MRSISCNQNQGPNNGRYTDNYYYQENKIKSRTETNVYSGDVLTYKYAYSNNVISTVQSHAAGDTLETEISINDDSNQRVASYFEINHANANSPTSWQATFLYDNDKVLHCDGQTWSSVEYKDICDGVYLYTTNENGDFVQYDSSRRLFFFCHFHNLYL